MESPLFIFGVARSGTTYLRRLAGSLPGVYLLYESRLIEAAHDIWQSEDVLRNHEAFLGFIEQLKPLVVEAEDLLDRSETAWGELFRRCLDSRSFPDFCEALFACKTGGPGIWGNKLIHPEQLQRVLKLFPDARLVVIVRDVRAVVASLQKQPGEHHVLAALHWVQSARLVRSLEGRSGLREPLLLRYEDVVSEAGTTLEQMARFLGLDPPVDYAIAQSAHARSIDHWRMSLRPRVVREIEEIAYGEMRSFGYEPEEARGTRRPGWTRMSLALLAHFWGRWRAGRAGLRSLGHFGMLRRYLSVRRQLNG